MLLQHIALAADWDRALATGTYDRSTLGASVDQVGFVHCSDGPDQVATVLERVYADLADPLVLLTLDPAALHRAGRRVVMEPGDPQRPDGEWFPHVYGGPIPVETVASAEPMPRAEPVASAEDGWSPADEAHLLRSINLATGNSAADGGPFGAVLVMPDGRAFEGTNRVTAGNDPTAHAEVVAIRAAGAGADTFDLHGAVLYASCEPCPMCLAASLWARISRVVFAADRHEAAAAGFDDAAFYDYVESEAGRDIMPLVHRPHARRSEPFEAWNANGDRIEY